MIVSEHVSILITTVSIIFFICFTNWNWVMIPFYPSVSSSLSFCWVFICSFINILGRYTWYNYMIIQVNCPRTSAWVTSLSNLDWFLFLLATNQISSNLATIVKTVLFLNEIKILRTINKYYYHAFLSYVNTKH